MNKRLVALTLLVTLFVAATSLFAAQRKPTRPRTTPAHKVLANKVTSLSGRILSPAERRALAKVNPAAASAIKRPTASAVPSGTAPIGPAKLVADRISILPVAQQTGARCGYYALYNAWAEYNRLLGRAVPVFPLPQWLRIIKIDQRGNPKDSGDWIDQIEMVHLAQHSGINSEIYSVIPDILQFALTVRHLETAPQLLNLPDIIRRLRTQNNYTHSFVLGSMGHYAIQQAPAKKASKSLEEQKKEAAIKIKKGEIPPPPPLEELEEEGEEPPPYPSEFEGKKAAAQPTFGGKRGHWIAIIARRENGRINYLVMDSLGTPEGTKQTLEMAQALKRLIEEPTLVALDNIGLTIRLVNTTNDEINNARRFLNPAHGIGVGNALATVQTIIDRIEAAGKLHDADVAPQVRTLHDVLHDAEDHAGDDADLIEWIEALRTRLLG